VEVPNRYLAGITEVALKNYYADNWRKMLTNSIEPVDLLAERLKLEKNSVRSTGIFLLNKNDLYEMHYPVMHTNKVKSLSLERHQFYRKIDWHKRAVSLFEDGTVLIFVVQRDM
jgi:hypothetical protein